MFGKFTRTMIRDIGRIYSINLTKRVPTSRCDNLSEIRAASIVRSSRYRPTCDRNRNDLVFTRKGTTLTYSNNRNSYSDDNTTNTNNNNNNNNNNERNNDNVLYAFGIAALTQFLGLSDPKEESELIQIIRKGEIALLKKEYDKSERIFHLALKVAQELRDENGVTYIYDRLANIAFDTGNNEKARKLFVNVMQRLLDKGMEKDDLVMIHISFKLAKIFENIRDFETADVGFRYCIETLKPKLASDEDGVEDATALWFMIANGYAYFLYYAGRLDEALKYFEEARLVHERTGGQNDESLILLLNNLGTVSKLKGDADAALRYFQQAEKLGTNLPEMENFSFVYLNLAYLYMEFKLLAKARVYCEKAMANAKRHEYQEGKKESEECIVKVREALLE